MNLIRRVLGVLWRSLDRLRKVLHLIVLLCLFVAVLAATRHPMPLVPSKAALVVRPEGRIVEQLSGSPFDRSLGAFTGDHEPETLLRDLIDSIHAAAHDSRIRVIVLDTDDMNGGGLTKLRALGEALADFRKTGKKVLAFGRYAGQEQYYLMAQADEVYIDPAGAVGVMGYAAYGLYFRDVLDKLGVEINVFKVGTHKSFTEPYTRRDMSPEDREQTLGWMTPLWKFYQEGVETPRRLPAGSIDGYVRDVVPLLKNAGGDAALLAEQRGLITGRKTALQFERELVGLVGEDTKTHSFTSVDYADYLVATRTEATLTRHPAGEVAVLVAAGNIVDGERPPGEIGGDSFAAVLRAARYDHDVKAVVLRIDSGGGSMLASEVIRQEVEALKAAGKPVVASFSSVAASGGYYIAMDADQIWAEPTTITGSIGVFGLVPTFAGTLAKIGVASDGVATSPLAGSMHLERALAPETREVLQLGVEHAYRTFVEHVAQGRKRTPEQIEQVAEGRVFLATDALKYGLVDHLGGVDGAVREAARLAKLPDGKYGVSWREKAMTWRERLLRELRAEGEGLARVAGLTVTPPAVARVMGDADRTLRLLSGFNDPRHLYFYCACDIP